MREFPRQAFLVGLSSIHWREAWKYGERAFRYCQHDAGHAIGTFRIAAATLGWSAVVLQGLAHETIEGLLGLNRAEDFAGAEREEPELVMLVWPNDSTEPRHAGAPPALPLALDPLLVREFARHGWRGICRAHPAYLLYGSACDPASARAHTLGLAGLARDTAEAGTSGGSSSRSQPG